MANNLRGFATATAAGPVATLATSVFDVDPQNTDAIAVFASHQRDTSETISSVTDSVGSNTYNIVSGCTLTIGGLEYRVYLALNVTAAAGMTVTVNWTGGTLDIGIYAIAVSGAALSAALGLSGGQTQTTPGTGTDAVSTGALGTPAEDGHIVLSVARTSTLQDVLNAGTGYTGLTAIGGPKARAEYLIQTTAAAVTATYTADAGGGSWATAALTLKPAAAAGGPIFLPRSQHPDHQNLIASLSL